MKILAVDDEKLALESLMDSVKKAVPDAELSGFRKPQEALEYVSETGCDVAFLDIEMRGMTGIEVAECLKQINPQVNVIFTTGYSEYAGDAFRMHASGYIMKPITPEKVKRELEVLRFPIGEEKSQKVQIQAFGNFEVFIDHQPVRFQYSKTKELLAYLVDRNGALCTNQEIIATLWEDAEDTRESSHISYMKNIRTDLATTLEAFGCADVLVRQRGRMGIIPEKVECDYFDYLAGKENGIRAFRGEYMTQYSWGEYTLGTLL